MQSREKTPPNHKIASQPPDRLTQVLIIVAVILSIVVIALSADLWSTKRAGETVPVGTRSASAPLPTRPLPTLTPSPAPVTPPACVPPSDWITYGIQAGNTLYALAERFGTDVETLKRVNCLESDLILVNQELYVPGPPSVPTPAAAVIEGRQPLPPLNVQTSFAERFLNILLLGSDKRENSSTWRTDTMIVVSVDMERNVVRLLSIPRDLWVSIPGQGYNRINTADLWGELAREGGGPELVKETIYQNLGIPIHYHVRADFEGFVEIIDAVGGVDVDVECPLPDIEFMPGMHHMDGEDALLYARSRISTSDFDRSRRQRKLLMALWSQHLNTSVVPKLPALWLAVNDAFETDMPLDQVIGLAYVGLQLKPNRIFSQSIGPWQVENWITPGGASVLLPIQDKIQELLDGFYGPIDLQFLERVSQTRVQVLDGSPIQDAGQLAATNLGWAGFQVVGTEEIASQDYPETQINVYNTGEDIAETLGMILELPPTSLNYQPDPSSPVDIQVVLGWDYDPCATK